MLRSWSVVQGQFIIKFVLKSPQKYTYSAVKSCFSSKKFTGKYAFNLLGGNVKKVEWNVNNVPRM